jgi:uncharacterized membrane protein
VLTMHGGSNELIRFSMEFAAHAIELLAVAIILAGVTGGTMRFLFRWASYEGYNQYKQTLDKALLLGLNVLVAADIVRTVALEPTITNILGLGLLVLVRTFVSWSLLVELEERWPWQVRGPRVIGESVIDKANVANVKS